MNIFFSFITVVPHISSNARWNPDGITVAGGNGTFGELNQLYNPHGLYVDDDQTVYVTDCVNQRIVQWRSGATSGQLVAGGNDAGNRTDQLYCPSDVTVDKQTDSLIICDKHNQRVMRWPRQGGTSGEILIWPIECEGLTMDDKGFLYVSDIRNHEVRRWRVGETSGTLVAGGKGQGNRLDQLSTPIYISVGLDQSVYVSDLQNDRVMKWANGAKEGIVVAGGQGPGSALTQVSRPKGVVVDQLGTVYVTDRWNYRVTRWPQGATSGSIIVGGNGEGNQTNQFGSQGNLSFDRQGNLYVVDLGNSRVQKFQIIVPQR